MAVRFVLVRRQEDSTVIGITAAAAALLADEVQLTIQNHVSYIAVSEGAPDGTRPTYFAVKSLLYQLSTSNSSLK
jgi:hypothetical protein